MLDVYLRSGRAFLARLHCEVFTIPAELLSHVRQMRVRVAAPPLTVSEFAQPPARLRDVRAAITATASGRP